MSTDLTQHADTTITAEQVNLIKSTIAKGATDVELQLYFYDCKRHGVHPLDKLIHFTKRGKGDDRKYTPITSIDLLRSRAADTDELGGIDDAVFHGQPMQPDFSATVTVWRIVKGQRCPFTATARWAEYIPQEQFMWKKMPHLMLSKCAQALALRTAFPKQLAGLYAKEEMDQHDSVDLPKQIAQTQPELAESKFATPTTPVRPPAPAAPAEPRTTINKNEASVINGLLVENGVPWEWLLKKLEVTRAGEITLAQLDNILANIAHMKKQYDDDQEEEIVINDANEEAVGV